MSDPLQSYREALAEARAELKELETRRAALVADAETARLEAIKFARVVFTLGQQIGDDEGARFAEEQLKTLTDAAPKPARKRWGTSHEI